VQSPLGETMNAVSARHDAELRKGRGVRTLERRAIITIVTSPASSANDRRAGDFSYSQLLLGVARPRRQTLRAWHFRLVAYSNDAWCPVGIRAATTLIARLARRRERTAPATVGGGQVSSPGQAGALVALAGVDHRRHGEVDGDGTRRNCHRSVAGSGVYEALRGSAIPPRKPTVRS
jgi:hypothetical protein